MITEFLEGPLPGGGEVAVENWSWDNVSGERNANGHIWGGPWHIIGIWDGTQLTVTRIPLPVPEIEFNPATAATPGCNSDGFTETRSRISELDFRSIGLLSDNVLASDGACGLVISAIVDSAELREQLAPFADDIEQYQFLLKPVSGA